MKAKDAERSKAIEDLRATLKPGDTIYTKLNHVSRSGMYRVIDLLVIRNNQPLRISWSASQILEGYALYPDGFTCTGKNCPSNDHSNGDRNYRRHHHNSGGYAFRQRWI